MRTDAGKLRSAALLALIAAAALWLRIAALDQESAWCDEALSAACLPADSLGAYLQRAFESDPVIRIAPLYHLVQYAWAQAVGPDLTSLRLLSVTLSMISLAQLYCLARNLFGNAAARWAVLLQALSLFQIYYAQEVRMYALVNVLALFSMQAFLNHWQTGRVAGLWWAVVANILLIMTHSFGILIALPQAALLILRWPQKRPLAYWSAGHLGIVALYLLWLRLIGYNLGSESMVLSDRLAGLREVAAFALQFAGGRFTNVNPGPYLARGWNAEIPILMISAGLLAYLAAAIIGKEQTKKYAMTCPAVGVLVLWIVLPTLALYVAGQAWRPCFYTRYIIYCAAPFAILLGAALDQVKPRFIQHSVGTVLVALLLWQNLALPRPFRVDYQALTRIVAADQAQEKVVLALKPFNYLAAAYALRDSPTPVEQLYGLKETIGIARARAADGRSVWVVFYKWDDLEAFEKAMKDEGFAVSLIETAGMPPAHIYHVQPPKAQQHAARENDSHKPAYPAIVNDTLVPGRVR